MTGFPDPRHWTVTATTTGQATITPLVAVTGDFDPAPWLVDTRSPLEQTLDTLVAASQDLAQALRDHHAASTEPAA